MTLAEGLNTAGGVFEIAGIFMVVLGILARREFAGLPPIAKTVADWTRRTIAKWRRKSPPDVSGSATSSSGIISQARLEARSPWDDLNLDQRLQHLKNRLEELENQTERLRDELGQEVIARKAAADAERVARTEGDRELGERIDDLAVGDIKWEAIGVLLLICGVVLTTWPHGIAALLT